MFNKRIWDSEKGVYLFEIGREDGMRALVSNYGGILRSLYAVNASGRIYDLVLGYDTLEEYIQSETFFGAMVGPLADRLANGSFCVNGEKVQLALNAGPDTMHSGPGGFHGRIWNWEELEDGVSFSSVFTPQDCGFSGKLQVRLNYRMPEPNVLRIEYRACCDRETCVSFTNHSYFNLDGAKNSCRDHKITIHADTYAETCREEEPICTGRALPVAGTPLDFTRGKPLQDALASSDFREIRTAGGLDHYFPVNGEGMRAHAEIESAASGLRLCCSSDAPGVLVYSANGLESETGKGGTVYGKNWGVCFETERFPNSANFPERFSDVLLRPGETYESATEFCIEQIGV